MRWLLAMGSQGQVCYQGNAKGTKTTRTWVSISVKYSVAAVGNADWLGR